MERNYQYYDATSSVLIHAPHGGRHITDLAWGSLVISDEEVKAELAAMTDSHTDRMAQDISAHALAYGRKKLIPARFINHLSRLVVDPERFNDASEEMNQVGMGVVYTHGSRRQQIRVEDEAVKERLIRMYYTPYASSLEYNVDSLFKRNGKVTILDLHSYASVALPYELHQEDARPEICLGTDDFHTPVELIDAVQRILECHDFEVTRNQPFAGTYVPLKHYGQDSRVSSLMVEIRRDMYMDEVSGKLDKDKYDKLVIALALAVDEIS